MAKKFNLTITVTREVDKETLAMVFALLNGEEDHGAQVVAEEVPTPVKTEPVVEEKPAQAEPTKTVDPVVVTPVVEEKPAQAEPIKTNDPVADSGASKDIRPKALKPVKKLSKYGVSEAENFIDARIERDGNNPEMVAALLACRQIIETLADNGAKYTDRERTELRAFLVQEIADCLQDLRQFEEHMDAEKLAQSYYDRVVDWVKEKKYGKPPHFIVLGGNVKTDSSLPHKFTAEKIEELVDRCVTIDELERIGWKICGYLKGDDRYSDNKRQELLLVFSVRAMGLLIKLHVKPEEADAMINKLMGAMPKVPQPRQRRHEEPRSDSAPPTDPSPMGSSKDEAVAKSIKGPVSEAEKEARRKKDAELAAAKKTARAARMAKKKDPRDPNYGQARTVVRSQSKKVAKKEAAAHDGGKKSGRNGKAA